MAEYIGCKDCASKNCAGCNIFTLATMLNNGAFDGMMDDHRSIIPAADVVERKRGRWIIFVEDDSPWDSLWKCSCCGAYGTTEEPVHKNFCPNCGADMRQEA